MPTKTTRLLARGAVVPVAALALASAVTGCKGAVTVSAPASGTSSGTSSGAVPAAATSPASAAGSLTVSITSPVTLSGSDPVAVSCASGIGYHAEATSAVIHGDQVSYTVAVARYHGPGSYPAVVAVTLRQSTGVVTTLAGVSKVPAQITASGGSFSVSATSAEGRTFTGSLTWTCGS
jgi:hypothetical protein